jgi:hypothetical protein
MPSSPCFMLFHLDTGHSAQTRSEKAWFHAGPVKRPDSRNRVENLA